jgi:type I restriction enzyme S subunit
MSQNSRGKSNMKTLPDDWRYEAIKDVTTETSLTDPRKVLLKQEFLYVDISGIDNEKGTIREYRRLSGEEAPSRARRKIRENDVLVSTVRPNLNATAMVPKSLDDQVCSTGFCVLRSNGIVAPKYLYFFTRTPQFVKALMGKTKGASYPAVSVDDVKSVEIPVPPIEIQRGIVALLERADAIRHKKDKARKLTEKIIWAAFLKMFGDPVENPKGWPKKKVGDISLEIKAGFAYGRFNLEKGTPHLRPFNISTSGWLELGLLKYLPEEKEVPAEYLLSSGDLVFNNTNSRELVGKTALFRLSTKATLSNHMTRIRLDSEVAMPEYVWLTFNLLFRHGVFAWICKRWVNQVAVDMNQLSALEIPVPPINDQRTYASIVTTAEKVMRWQNQSSQEIDELFRSLLQKAFKGELLRGRQTSELGKPLIQGSSNLQ